MDLMDYRLCLPLLPMALQLAVRQVDLPPTLARESRRVPQRDGRPDHQTTRRTTRYLQSAETGGPREGDDRAQDRAKEAGKLVRRVRSLLPSPCDRVRISLSVCLIH